MEPSTVITQATHPRDPWSTVDPLRGDVDLHGRYDGPVPQSRSKNWVNGVVPLCRRLVSDYLTPSVPRNPKKSKVAFTGDPFHTYAHAHIFGLAGRVVGQTWTPRKRRTDLTVKTVETVVNGKKYRWQDHSGPHPFGPSFVPETSLRHRTPGRPNPTPRTYPSSGGETGRVSSHSRNDTRDWWKCRVLRTP